jgi:hypothetical protein
MLSKDNTRNNEQNRVYVSEEAAQFFSQLSKATLVFLPGLWEASLSVNSKSKARSTLDVLPYSTNSKQDASLPDRSYHYSIH